LGAAGAATAAGLCAAGAATVKTKGLTGDAGQLGRLTMMSDSALILTMFCVSPGSLLGDKVKS
jgi:hypothetical protein